MSSVVIGAGLAGISAALTLQEAGEDVELFEASDAVGGRVRSDYVDGYILDRGFQLINTGYPELKRLGVIREIDFRKAPRSIDVATPFGVSTIGDPREHLLSGLRSPLGSLGEKIALLKFLREPANSAITLRDALLASGTGDLYENLLKPFLRGVFLTELEKIDSSYGREIIKSFIRGDSGLPAAGAGTLSEALAARVENIHLSAQIDSLEQFAGKKIIVATDHKSAARLLGIGDGYTSTDSVTWYHSLPAGLITTPRLRVSSVESPIVNTIAISNMVNEYAPEGRTLLSTTSIGSVSDSEIVAELAKFWGVESSGFTLVKRYEIKSSLPIFATGNFAATSAHVIGDVFRAGDYLTSGSQNGALLSGRLAALESLAY
jgi:hypothetical protein